jgi:hypothetical protein
MEMRREGHERRWRDALEGLDAADIRRRLQQSTGDNGGDAPLTGIVREAPHPPRYFVDSWYRESRQRMRRARHARLYVAAVLGLGVVTAGIVFLSIP